MQGETLKAFVDDVNNIRDYIKYIHLINKVEIAIPAIDDDLLIDVREHLQKFGVSKKIFEYKSITISLYGILEKYIGVWIKEYVSHLPKIINNYNDLTIKFRDNHFDLSVKLLALISEKKHAKYEGLKREKVLEKLNSCIENPSGFQLNSDAFYLRSGNLKHAKIAEALHHLDIQLTAKLKIVGQRSGGFLSNGYHNIENRGDDVFRLIDELVTLRNDIAHGEDVDNILSVTEFNEYIDFLEGYGVAVFQTLTEKLNELEANCLYDKIDEDNVKGVFGKGTILCFEVEDTVISKGDYIIVNLIDGGFIKKEILEIQKDSQSFDTLSIKDPESIGVRVDKGISKKQGFFIKKSGN